MWGTSFVGPAHRLNRGDLWGTSGNHQGPAGNAARKQESKQSPSRVSAGDRRCRTPLYGS
eukprot:4716012-Heterocapsa_arctica.AAC.1